MSNRPPDGSAQPPAPPRSGDRRPNPRAERAHRAALEAALALFLERGVPAVTIDAVSARSGVAKTTIYRRWANRDDVLVDVFRQFSLDLELPPPDLSPSERVRRVMRQFTAALATPAWQRALPAMLGAMQHRGDLAPLQGRIEAHRTRVLSTVIADAVADGALPADTDPGEALLVLTGPVVMAALTRPDTLTEAFADRLVARFFAGASGAPHRRDGEVLHP
jgi:AcrR family transcriptional regulator